MKRENSENNNRGEERDHVDDIVSLDRNLDLEVNNEDMEELVEVQVFME